MAKKGKKGSKGKLKSKGNNGGKATVALKDLKSNSYAGDGINGYATDENSSAALGNLTSNMAIDAKLDTSNPFDFITDRADIENTMNNATNLAYLQKMKEAQQAYNQAEDTNFTNTQNAVNEMRRNLIGSASSGANVGASNATALQAMLGLGQQNAATTTEGMQNIQNVAGEKAAQLAQNASDAIDKSNTAKQMQGQLATDQYAALVGAQGQRAASAAEAVGNLASAIDTNRTNAAMNTATNYKDLAVAMTPQKQYITTKTKK